MELDLGHDQKRDQNIVFHCCNKSRSNFRPAQIASE